MLKKICVLVRTSIALIKYYNLKQLEEAKVYFILQFSCHALSLKCVMAGIQGRTLETGTEAETVEECCYQLDPYGLLTLSSYITQGYIYIYIYQVYKTQPRDGITHRELPPFNHQPRNCKAGLQLGSLMEAFSQLSYFTDNSACVQLTKQNEKKNSTWTACKQKMEPYFNENCVQALATNTNTVATVVRNPATCINVLFTSRSQAVFQCSRTLVSPTWVHAPHLGLLSFDVLYQSKETLKFLSTKETHFLPCHHPQ